VNGMPSDPIQGQGHGGPKVAKIGVSSSKSISKFSNACNQKTNGDL